MKRLLQEIAEESGARYQLWAELTPCAHPDGYQQLIFSSVWTGAKNPEQAHRRGEMLLSSEAVKNLQELLASNT